MAEVSNNTLITIILLALAITLISTWTLFSKLGVPVSGLVSNPTGTVSASVQSTVDIFLQDSLVSFGAVQVGVTYDGSRSGNWSNASAFLLRNDGSVRVNITISATSLWTSTSGNQTNYQFNTTNATSNTSLKETCYTAQSTWTTVPMTSATYAMCQLNFSDTNDYANVSIRITVPTGEAAGTKTSTVTFTASAG